MRATALGCCAWCVEAGCAASADVRSRLALATHPAYVLGSTSCPPCHDARNSQPSHRIRAGRGHCRRARAAPERRGGLPHPRRGDHPPWARRAPLRKLANADMHHCGRPLRGERLPRRCPHAGILGGLVCATHQHMERARHATDHALVVEHRGRLGLDSSIAAGERLGAPLLPHLGQGALATSPATPTRERCGSTRWSPRCARSM